MIDIEEIGTLADSADNALAALAMPLPERLHIEGMKGVLEDVRAKLRAYYVQETGENPWEDSANG